MKNVLLFLIIAIGIFTTATDSFYQIYFGAQLGPNYELGYFHNTSQDLIHTTGKLNLFVGGLLEFNFSDNATPTAIFVLTQRIKRATKIRIYP